LINAILIDPATSKSLATVSAQGHTVLVISTIPQIVGTFKSVSRTSAGTSVIVQPPGGGAVIMTDMIVAAEKKNSAVVTLRFSDGVETINFYQGSVTDAPINFGIALAGNWLGWRDARVELNVSSNNDVTVSVGYYFIPQGKQFELWDSERNG